MSAPRNSTSPAKRFFAATLAGIAAPLVVITALAICFGNLPTAANLLGLLPLSLMLSLLSVAPWFILQREALATRWFVSIVIPVGLAIDASAILMLLEAHSNSYSSAAVTHYNGWFVVGNGIWAMVVSLAAASVSHWLLPSQSANKS
ncbi:MAG: hypothetical protein WC714_14900 [Candidatus Obscuribacterales bacterium]|jgi:hypothetical protein